jgi:SUMO ligase MMS21 Smc5/6 complex component
MEQVMNVVAFGNHSTSEICYSIVILHQSTTCRHCRKIITAHELAIRQTMQNRRNQYYHLNGRCRLLHDRDLKQYIRLNLNVDGNLP